MYVMSDAPLKLPEVKRLHHPGSSMGDTIYDVVKTPPENDGLVKWSEKRKALGKRLQFVGGKTELPEGAEAATRRGPDTLVPMTYHCAPEKFFHELVHCFFGKLVIDLSCMNTTFAWLCLKERIGYCGMAYSAEHIAILEAQLFQKMQQAMMNPTSRWYNPHFAAAMGVVEDKKKKPTEEHEDEADLPAAEKNDKNAGVGGRRPRASRRLNRLRRKPRRRRLRSW